MWSYKISEAALTDRPIPKSSVGLLHGDLYVGLCKGEQCNDPLPSPSLPSFPFSLLAFEDPDRSWVTWLADPPFVFQFL